MTKIIVVELTFNSMKANPKKSRFTIIGGEKVLLRLKLI